MKAGNLGHRPRAKGGYFPVAPVDSAVDIRGEMVSTMLEMGLPMRQAPSRGGGCPARARPDLRHAGDDGRPHAGLQICRAPGGAGLWQDGDVHAEADQGGQRFGDAHASSRSGRAPSRCSRATAMPGSPNMCALLHRRHHQARQGDATPSPTRRPTATSGWCPGYEAPVLLAYSSAQPLGFLPYSLRHGRQGQARRGPLPGCDRQPLSLPIRRC